MFNREYIFNRSIFHCHVSRPPKKWPCFKSQPRHCRRGTAHILGHRRQTSEDQGGTHRITQVSEDRQEGVVVPTFLAGKKMVGFFFAKGCKFTKGTPKAIPKTHKDFNAPF